MRGRLVRGMRPAAGADSFTPGRPRAKHITRRQQAGYITAAIAMRAKLLKYWEHVRASFWFLPSLMAAAAVVLALLAVMVDHRLDDKWLNSASWVYGGGAE